MSNIIFVSFQPDSYRTVPLHTTSNQTAPLRLSSRHAVS